MRTEPHSDKTRDVAPSPGHNSAANLGTGRSQEVSDSMDRAKSSSVSALSGGLAAPASNGAAVGVKEAGAASSVCGSEQQSQCPEGQGERGGLQLHQDGGDVAAPDGICIDTGHA